MAQKQAPHPRRKGSVVWATVLSWLSSLLLALLALCLVLMTTIDLLDNAAAVINGGTVDEPDAQPDRLPLSSVTYPSEGDRYATITISGTNVDAPVYYGDTNKILNAGVGTYKDDSRVGIPGEGKTILLAGHNNTFFNDLQHAEAGATVTIDLWAVRPPLC